MPEEKIQKDQLNEATRLKRSTSVARTQTAEGWKRNQMKMRRSAKSVKSTKS